MHFPNISLLLLATLGLTQALVIPGSEPDTTIVEKRDAASQLSRVVTRPYKCPLADPKKCTTCGTMTLTKGTKPALKPAPCKKGQKGCKRDQVRVIEERGFNVVMDKTGGTPWGPGETFGTRGLGGCTFIVVYDKDYVAGSHIPPARGEKVNRDLVLKETGEDVIKDHMKKLDAELPKMKQTKSCIIVHALLVDADNLKIMKTALAARGLNCVTKAYDHEKAGEGVFLVHRNGNDWPPRQVGVV